MCAYIFLSTAGDYGTACVVRVCKVVGCAGVRVSTTRCAPPSCCLNRALVVTNDVEFVFFFQAEDGIRDSSVTGVQTCALPILLYVRFAKARDAQLSAIQA